MKDLCFALFGLAIASQASIAGAQGRDHDGFMLRLTAGAGFGSVTEEVSGGGLLPENTKVELSGGGILFGVDVGGSPVENLVLHGRFSFFSMASPDVSFAGETYDGVEDSSVSLILFAPAVTYYIMPANLYVTGAVGLAIAGMTIRNRSSSTDMGWGLNFDLGWEFWLGKHASWGMGPALRFFYSAVPDDIEGDDDPTVNGIGGGVLFTATFQ